MVAFKDPLTLDIGYLSSLGSSFVIDIQAWVAEPFSKWGGTNARQKNYRRFL